MSFPHHKTHLPSIRAITALEAAFRHSSFTGAASELNVTQGAISRQIQELEKLLGVELFLRSGPNLTATQAGINFAESSVQVLSLLREAVEKVQPEVHKTHVTLSMLPSVAAKWLAPRLGKFVSEHPDIDLRISATRNLVDFRAEDIDAGIRYGRGNWTGLSSELLAKETIAPVCTADYAQHIGITSPRDISKATIFHTDIEENWKTWLQAVGHAEIIPPRGLQLGDDAATLQATLNGQGIALGRSVLVADDIAAGRLIYPFQESIPATFSYWYVIPTGTEIHPDHMAVKEWIFSEF